MTILTKHITVRKGFVIAGLMNLSVLIFSRFFTNQVIPKYDPVVMSNFGLLMIVVWGLAYIAVARKHTEVKWLVAVFAVEKLIYGLVWINWLCQNSITTVFEEDKMAGIFYAVYGVNDWVFFVFFSWVFGRCMSTKD
ncbi:MAG: hypothetical protein WBG71_15340 [Leeuwenhoekiella sp.]